LIATIAGLNIKRYCNVCAHTYTHVIMCFFVVPIFGIAARGTTTTCTRWILVRIPIGN